MAQAEQALLEAQREALIMAHCPQLWVKRRRAERAREADPWLNDYREPGASIRARARHQQVIDAVERDIAAALEAAGVA